MWKERIKLDFGYDLPFGDGDGNSIECPIIIQTKDAYEAASSKLTLLRCIMSTLEVMWKVIGNEIININGRKIEMLRFDVKWPENDQVITETRAYYFDVTNVDDQSNNSPALYGFRLGEKIGIGLPFQLDWLHFVDKTDFDYQSSGLGQSYAYSAMYIKATIYVYNKSYSLLNHITTADIFKNEFENVNNEYLLLNPNSKISWDEQDQNILLKSYDIDEAYSVVLLSIVNNYFIKLRLTNSTPSEGYVFKCMNESIAHLIHLLKHGIATRH